MLGRILIFGFDGIALVQKYARSIYCLDSCSRRIQNTLYPQLRQSRCDCPQIQLVHLLALTVRPALVSESISNLRVKERSREADLSTGKRLLSELRAEIVICLSNQSQEKRDTSSNQI